MMAAGSEGGHGEGGVSADFVWRPDGPTEQGSETPAGECTTTSCGRGCEPQAGPKALLAHCSASDMRARLKENLLSGNGSLNRRSNVIAPGLGLPVWGATELGVPTSRNQAMARMAEVPFNRAGGTAADGFAWAVSVRVPGDAKAAKRVDSMLRAGSSEASAGSTAESQPDQSGSWDRGILHTRFAGLFPTASQKRSGSVAHTVGCALRHPLRPVVGQFDILVDDAAQQAWPSAKIPGLRRSTSIESGHVDLSLRGMQIAEEDTSMSSSGRHKRHQSRTHVILEKARWGSASYKFSGDSSQGQDEDSLQLQKILAYVRPVSKIIIAIVDLLTALSIQLFWSIDDFACLHAENGRWTEGHVRTHITSLICIVLVFHAYMIILELSATDPSDHLLILRFVRRWQAEHHVSASQLSYSQFLANLPALFLALLQGFWKLGWHLFILSLSVGTMWAHWHLCDTFESAEKAATDWGYVFVRRLHLVVHFVRAFGTLWECMGMREELEARVRAAVSLNKRRYICNKTLVDLDLTYVCDRLIAMAVPCVDGKTVYRNNIREVARFFASLHYGHFLIFNLCEDFEEGGNGNYDNALLYGQVQKMPMHDHNAPTLHDLVSFCEQASAWLERQKDNVVAVHCQGGKGRTGCFCAALSLWTGFRHDAKSSLDYFALRRTDRRRGTKHVQGVAAPCQIRYVHYVEAMLEDPMLDCWSPPKVLLQRVTVQTMPMHTKESIYVMFLVESNGQIEHDHFKENGLVKMTRCNPAADEWSFDVQAVLLQGDVSVRFFVFEEDITGVPSKDFRKSRQAVLGNGARSIKVGRHVGKQLFFVTFHTSFHPGQLLTFSKQEIDGAYNRSDHVFLPEFSVTLTFLEHDHALELHAMLERSMSLGQTLKQLRNNSAADALSPVARAALQAYTNHFVVRDMICNAFPETKTYRKGEVIWKDAVQGASNEIFYIVSGSCCFHDPNVQPWEVNNGTYLDKQPKSSGSFVGIKRFLLGSGAELEVPDVHAWTEVVVVRKLTLGRSPDGHVPLEIKGLSEKQVHALYEAMARDIWSQEVVMQEMLRRLTIQAHAKHDTNVDVPRAERQRQTRALVDRYKLPSTEQLIELVTSDRVLDEAFVPGHSTGSQQQPSHASLLNGSLCLFSSYLIFSGVANADVDLVLPIRDLVDAKLHGGTLSVSVFSDASDKTPGTPGCGGDMSERFSGSFHPRIRRASTETRLIWEPMALPTSPVNLPVSSPTGSNTGASNSQTPSPNSLGALAAPPLHRQRGWNKLRGLFGKREAAGHENTHTVLSSRRTNFSGSTTSLDRRQGVLVTFVFRPWSAQAGEQLCEAVRSRILEVSKVLTIRDLQRKSDNTLRDDAAEAGFGYAYPDDPESEGGRAGGGLQSIFPTSAAQRFRNGEVIAYEGATERTVYHVLSGKVFLLDSTSGAIAKELVAGDILGIDLLLQSGNRGLACRAIAAGDVEVLALPEREITLLTCLKERQDPMLGARIYRNFAISSALRAQADLLTLKAWRTLSNVAVE